MAHERPPTPFEVRHSFEGWRSSSVWTTCNPILWLMLMLLMLCSRMVLERRCGRGDDIQCWLLRVFICEKVSGEWRAVSREICLGLVMLSRCKLLLLLLMLMLVLVSLKLCSSVCVSSIREEEGKSRERSGIRDTYTLLTGWQSCRERERAQWKSTPFPSASQLTSCGNADQSWASTGQSCSASRISSHS